MRVLITGASGFTGRYLIALLEQNCFECVSLSANLLDVVAIEKELFLAQPQAIIHLAAISFVPNSTGEAVYATNVIGTENLLKATVKLEQRPNRIILASSSHVYGQNSFPVETDCPAPINHYGASKLAMELIANTYRDQLNIVIVRPFTYTGIGQASHYLIPKLVKHFRDKSLTIELGNIRLARDFSDVRWVAQAYFSFLTSSLSYDVYNLCSGQATSFEQVIDYLSAESNYMPTLVINPLFVRQQDILKQHGSIERLATLTALDRAPSINDTLTWMLHDTTN